MSGPTRPPRAHLLGLYGVVAGLHLSGLGLLAWYGGALHGVAFAGAATLAYTLGLRHAFDADHISAIDDTARLLVQRGQAPWGVGLWFSLGHASVVFALSLVVTFAAGFAGGHLAWLQHAGAAFGGLAAGGYLYLVAGLNLVVLAGLVRSARRDEPGQGGVRGPLQRLLGARWLRVLRSERQLYWVGLVLGLGFDTASEIAILGLTATAASQQRLPPLAALALPLLFAAGMTLLDTTDGVFMVRLYGWALEAPRRKLQFNLVTTALSAAVALGVGTVELVEVCARAFHLRGPAIDGVRALDEHGAALGGLIVALFATTWAVAALLARRARPLEPAG